MIFCSLITWQLLGDYLSFGFLIVVKWFFVPWSPNDLLAIGICAIAWYLPRDCVLIMHFPNIFLPMPNIIFSIIVFFMMGAPNICYWNYHFVEINNFLISIVNTSFYSWVVICASHVEKALISSLNSLVEKIIKLKVGSCHLWILSFIIDMMEM